MGEPIADIISLGDDSIRDLNQHEEWALLDLQARRYLGLTAEEFLKAWRSGAFKGREDAPGVAVVTMLIPESCRKSRISL